LENLGVLALAGWKKLVCNEEPTSVEERSCFVRSAIFRINANSSEQQRSEGFSSYFFKQKSKQKAFFKFSEDFFHFTALHENHRLHFATCCVPISAIAIAKAGNALSQAQRLNL